MPGPNNLPSSQLYYVPAARRAKASVMAGFTSLNPLTGTWSCCWASKKIAQGQCMQWLREKSQLRHTVEIRFLFLHSAATGINHLNGGSRTICSTTCPSANTFVSGNRVLDQL